MALQREILRHQDGADQVRRQVKELEFRMRNLDDHRAACNGVLENHRLTLASDVVSSYREDLDTAIDDIRGLEKRHADLHETLDHHEKCISSRLDSVRRNQKRNMLEQQTQNYRAQLTRDVETVALRHQQERSDD
jgi:hypothetical protein